MPNKLRSLLALDLMLYPTKQFSVPVRVHFSIRPQRYRLGDIAFEVSWFQWSKRKVSVSSVGNVWVFYTHTHFFGKRDSALSLELIFLCSLKKWKKGVFCLC